MFVILNILLIRFIGGALVSGAILPKNGAFLGIRKENLTLTCGFLKYLLTLGSLFALVVNRCTRHTLLNMAP